MSRHETARGWSGVGRDMTAHSTATIVRRSLLALLVLAAPFVVLVRVSIAGAAVGAWFGVLAGAAAAAATLTLIAMLLARRLGRRPPPLLMRALALGMLVYCAYGLTYLGAAHAKSDDVRAEYRALHPSLRLALVTLILADEELLLTDGARRAEEYEAMGLPVTARSLHYRQPSGWVHAVDVRTRGRSAPRNLATVLYFRLMGLHAQRHGGTADHLHVWLPAS